MTNVTILTGSWEGVTRKLGEGRSPGARVCASQEDRSLVAADRATDLEKSSTLGPGMKSRTGQIEGEWKEEEREKSFL